MNLRIQLLESHITTVVTCGWRSWTVEKKVEGVIGECVEMRGEELTGSWYGWCGGGVDTGEVEMAQEVACGGEVDGVCAVG